MQERDESRPQKGFGNPGKGSRFRVSWPGSPQVILRRGGKPKVIVYYQNCELGTH